MFLNIVVASPPSAPKFPGQSSCIQVASVLRYLNYMLSYIYSDIRADRQKISGY